MRHVEGNTAWRNNDQKYINKKQNQYFKTQETQKHEM